MVGGRFLEMAESWNWQSRGNGRVVRMAKSWGGRVGRRRWFQEGARLGPGTWRVPATGSTKVVVRESDRSAVQELSWKVVVRERWLARTLHPTPPP